MSSHGDHKFNVMPTEDHSDELGHSQPFSIYRNVFLILLVFTVITVVISRFDFGVLNIVVAMLVASCKAMLVALFFMHLKYEKGPTWLYAVFPIVLLAILLAGVFIDNPLRVKVGPVKVEKVERK